MTEYGTRTNEVFSGSDAHLSEDQLDEVLMGIAEPAVRQHAARCATCGKRLATFQELMVTFNDATLAWSEARSNRMPTELAPAGARGWLYDGLGSRSRVAYAGAAVAALAMLIAGVMHDRGAAAPAPSGAESAARSDYSSSRQQEISNDNAMLFEISAELYQPMAIPDSLSEEHARGRNGDTTLKQAQD